MSNGYKITTKDGGSTRIFLTTAKTFRGALKRLVDHSFDFKQINNEDAKKMKITVERLK